MFVTARANPYIARNYKDALIRLESQNRVKTVPPATERRKIKGQTTFGDKVKVTFPRKS